MSPSPAISLEVSRKQRAYSNRLLIHEPFPAGLSFYPHPNDRVTESIDQFRPSHESCIFTTQSLQLQKWHTSTGINFAFSESKSNVQHPQQLRMKFSRLLLISTISLVAATLPAQAASYKSTNGTTILDLNESGSPDFAGLPKNSGSYVTFRGGNRVNGGITILTRNAAANNVTYTGTFEDYVGRPDTGCKGTIALNRTLLVGGGVALRSEWRIGQSGSRCQSPVGTQGSGELSGKPACC